MNTVLNFAREELDRYCKRIFGDAAPCDIRFVRTEQERNFFHDSFQIDIRGGKGTIAAGNDRSILLGVYRALKEIGCRFIRPGFGGEKIPSLRLEDFNVRCDIVPAYDHRGITIEGSVGKEDLIELIDWLPKAGFNSYFIQFRNGYEFYERWYKHTDNPLFEAEPFGEERAWQIHSEVIRELQKRGLIIHGVGHGWTCECFGISSTGWQKRAEVPEDIRSDLAMVGGERKFFDDIPLNTQLCYSQERVREKLVNEVVGYAKAHPEIDVLHFWLADGVNNVCECEECAAESVTDLYVRMLNAIDERLTAEGLATRITFLIYFDLYWPPKRERIHNPDRFVMLFAPIFRAYDKSYADYLGADEVEILPYKRNKNEYPHDIRAYMKFLREWRKCFGGDAFDFDYHMMWDIYHDLSGETLAEVLWKDIGALREMGLNGLISCQVQRAFFPAPLTMNLMADALFGAQEDLETYKKRFFRDTYAQFAELAGEIYQTVGKDVPFAYFTGGIPADDADALQRFRRALGYLRSKEESVQNAVASVKGDAFLTESLQNLLIYLQTLLLFLPCCIAKGEKRGKEELGRLFGAFQNYVNQREKESSKRLDGYYFLLLAKDFIFKAVEE